jgi:hypothetical protein
MSAPPSPHEVFRSVLRAGGVVVGLFGAFAVLPLRGDLWWVGVCIGAGLLIAVGPLALSRLRKVLASERPAIEAFEALVQLSAMLITGFAAVFYAVNRDGTELPGLDTRVDALYFTVTTLSTVGFGDIVPKSQNARILVMIQMVVDLIFVVVAIRVFAAAAMRRNAERQAAG